MREKEHKQEWVRSLQERVNVDASTPLGRKLLHRLTEKSFFFINFQTRNLLIWKLLELRENSEDLILGKTLNGWES